VERTDGLHGFKSRSEEWSRPLEPARRKRNHGASLRATTECEFDLVDTQIAQNGSNLDRNEKDC
jgi:hypothetical protein